MSAQYKPIIPCFQAMQAAGVHNMLDAAIFVHIGRCGTNGTTRPELLRQMPGHPYSSITSATNRLQEIGLITVVSKINKTGLPHCFTVTGNGWKLLTQPGDYTMFPQTVKPLGIQ